MTSYSYCRMTVGSLVICRRNDFTALHSAVITWSIVASKIHILIHWCCTWRHMTVRESVAGWRYESHHVVYMVVDWWIIRYCATHGDCGRVLTRHVALSLDNNFPTEINSASGLPMVLYSLVYVWQRKLRRHISALYVLARFVAIDRSNDDGRVLFISNQLGMTVGIKRRSTIPCSGEQAPLDDMTVTWRSVMSRWALEHMRTAETHSTRAYRIYISNTSLDNCDYNLFAENKLTPLSVTLC